MCFLSKNSVIYKAAWERSREWAGGESDFEWARLLLIAPAAAS